MLDRQQQLFENIERFQRGKRAIAGDALLERTAGHILHHNKESVRGLPHGINVDDIGMLQAGLRAPFRAEPLNKILSPGKLRLHDLERHLPVERLIDRLKHRAHPPFSEHAADLVILDKLSY